MALVTAQANGNWSSNGTWDLGSPPADGDTVHLGIYTVTVDVARIPASGTLAELSASSVGNLLVPINTLGDCEIHATSIIGGTNTTGTIQTSGAAPSNAIDIYGVATGGSVSTAVCIYHNSTATMNVHGDPAPGTASYTSAVKNASSGTVNILGNVAGNGTTSTYGCVLNNTSGTINVSGNVSGGSASNNYGIRNYSTGSVVVSGTITGGSATSAVGVWNSSTGTITMNGLSITGGSAAKANGIYCDSTGKTIINGANLIHTTTTSAVAGPCEYNPDADNYEQWPKTSGTVKFCTQLAAGLIASGTTHGDVTGTRVDCPENKAITTSGNYGDPGTPFVGTIDLTNCVAENIKDGVIIAGVEGTYEGGGGGGVASPIFQSVLIGGA